MPFLPPNQQRQSTEGTKIELINREHLTAAYKLQPNPSNPNSVELSEYFHDL